MSTKKQAEVIPPAASEDSADAWAYERGVALAMARANRHPHPEEYAERVVGFLNGDDVDVEPPEAEEGDR